MYLNTKLRLILIIVIECKIVNNGLNLGFSFIAQWVRLILLARSTSMAVKKEPLYVAK